MATEDDMTEEGLPNKEPEDFVKSSVMRELERETTSNYAKGLTNQEVGAYEPSELSQKMDNILKPINTVYRYDCIL